MSTPNPFDQFDAPATPTAKAQAAANPFDQFDAVHEKEPDSTASRLGGLTGRALLEGAAGTASDVAAMTSPVNAAMDAYQHLMHPKSKTDAYTPQLSDFVHPERWREAAHYFANKQHLPEPESAPERIYSSAVGALPSAVLAPENLGLGAASAMIGGASSQGAEEAGAGPVGQALAGLAGGSVLPAAQYGLSRATRALLGPGEEGVAGIRQRQADAAGITPLTAGEAIGNPTLQYIEALSSKAWGGGPLKDAMKRKTADTGSFVDDIVDQLSRKNDVTPTTAGEAIAQGVGHPSDKQGPTAFGSMREADNADYQKLDEIVPHDHPVDVSDTLDTLHQLGAPTPGAEQSSLISKSPIAVRYRTALLNDVARNAERGWPRPNTGEAPATPAAAPSITPSTRPSPVDLETPGGSPVAATPTRPAPSTQREPPATQPASTVVSKAGAEASSRPAIAVSPPPQVGLGGLGVTPQPVPRGANLGVESVTRPREWNEPISHDPLRSDTAQAFTGMGTRIPQPLPNRLGLAPDEVTRPAAWDEPSTAAPITHAEAPAFKSVGVRSPPAPLPNSQGLTPDVVKRPPEWDNPSTAQPLTYRDKQAFGPIGVTVPAPSPVMPYSAVRALKTDVGRSVTWDGLPTNATENGALKAIYGSLRGDIEKSVSGFGPEADEALRTANANHGARQALRQELARVVDTNGGPEAIYRNATSGLRAGATRIASVMGALRPLQQDMLRATILDRLGRANQTSGAPFNPNTFLTNWNKALSSEAKDVLFGEQPLRHDLDRLARTIHTVRHSTAIYNPSGNVEPAIKAAQGVAAWEALVDVLKGATGSAAKVGAGLLGNRWLARKLTNPNTVKWLADTTRLPPSAIPNAVNQLHRVEDPDAQELADYLTPRTARASGGKVDDDALLARLMTRWKNAKRATDATTKPLLALPDAAVIKALDLAQEHL